jgi:hypothetical protein
MNSPRQKTDLAIAAWVRLQTALKAHCQACDDRDHAEEKAHDAGHAIRRPLIMIAGDGCMDVEDARRSARRLPKAEASEAVEAMRTAVADWRQRRRKAGIAPLDASYRRADREWRDAMNAMGTTRAATARGLILKMQMIEVELRDGYSGFGEAILASAIADLSRIARRGR